MPPTTLVSIWRQNMLHSTPAILSICEDIFNSEMCHQLARSSGFIQRSSSKIKGHEFVKALVLPSYGLSEESLSGLCDRMREFNFQADISSSALAQRINTKAAVRFMRECFERTLKCVREKLEKQYCALEGTLKTFNNVYIQDSTVFEINKKLARFFPGTNRGKRQNESSLKSQMKIDLIHNFTTGQIAELQIYEGKLPDQALTGKIEKIIEANDLFLRDLGYFKIQSLKNIDESKAYFLTRFPAHVKVYLNPDDKDPIDLATYLSKHFKEFSAIDLNVWISEERLQVRLIAYRVPKDISADRRRKAHKEAKGRGRTLSKEKLAQMDFSLFVTNIPANILSVKVIGTVYRLRWEIELIFKTWKSQLKIDVLQGVCLQRILCLIWGRLCMVILIAHITAGFLNLAKRLIEAELSQIKLVNYLIRNGSLCKAVQSQTLQNLEMKIILDLPRRLIKDKRSRKTMRQQTIESRSYYEECDFLQSFDIQCFALA